MRIVHVLPAWQRCGAVTCVQCLLDQLPSAEFEQHVWSLSSRGSSPHPPAAAGTRTLHRRGPLDVAAAWKLRRAVVQLQPDVVHAWDGTLRFVAWSLRGTRVRIVAALRHWPAQGDRQAQAVRMLCRGMATLTAVSSRSVLGQLHGLGVPAARLHWVPPLVPGTQASGATKTPQTDAPQRSGGSPPQRPEINSVPAVGELPDDARVVLWAGTLRSDQRVEDAIWTADVIQPLVPALQLVLAGEGPHRTAAQRFALCVRRWAHMHFVGECPDLAAWRAASAAYWHPGADDVASCSLLEALAAGLPVLAADTPAHRELIVAGETGLLFPVGDTHAMARGALRLLEDAALAAALGSAARQRAAEQFPLAEAAARWGELYHRAAAWRSDLRAVRRSA